MKKIVKLIALFLFINLALMGQAGIGITDFHLESGDGKHLNSSHLSEMITVLFYETKDNTELNRQAKNQLNELFSSLSDIEQEKVMRLSVIDCTRASRLSIGIWKRQLLKNSKLEGIDIYGDWDGEMKDFFSFERDEAYLVIIDQKGLIRFFEKGQLNQKKIEESKNLLFSFLTE